MDNLSSRPGDCERYLADKSLRVDPPIEQEAQSIQFSVRTMLLITTNAAVLAALGQITNEALAGMGQMAKCYGVLLTINCWRFPSTLTGVSVRSKWTTLLIVFAACLPFIYLCIGSMFYEPHGLPPSKWIGAPIWIYTVPLLSFMIFDLSDNLYSPTAFLLRSTIEIVVVFYVWSAIWGFGQLLLGWAWI